MAISGRNSRRSIDGENLVRPPAESHRDAHRDRQDQQCETQAQQFRTNLVGGTGTQLSADHTADQQQHCQHDVDRPRPGGMDQRGSGGDEQNLEQRGADHHRRRHAEQIDHRGHHHETAADPQKDGENPGGETQQQWRERRDVQARAIEAEPAR
jgi:hypothetical protein